MYYHACIQVPCTWIVLATWYYFSSTRRLCDCTCVYDCWQTILKQELWTAFYLNGEGWAIGDGMWTMSAVVWTDGDDSDDEIPYDTSSGDE